MKSTFLILMITFLFKLSTQADASPEPLRGQAKIDSLLVKLQSAKGDTNEVNILSSLSANYNTIDPAKGIKYGLKGLNLSKKLEWKKGEANCYISLGLNYNFGSTDYKKALEYYQKSLRINRELGRKPEVALNLSNIGVVYMNLSNFPKALEYYQKSLRMNEENNDTSAISLNLGNMGIIYLNQNDYGKALEYFQKALKYSKQLNDKADIALHLGNIGIVYFSQMNLSEALVYYNKSIEIYDQLGNKSGKARNFGNIGLIYYNLSDYQSSISYFQKALNLYKELDDKSGIASNLGNIGELYLELSTDSVLQKIPKATEYISLDKNINLKNAFYNIKQAITIFEEIGSISEASYFYNILHQAYFQEGMFKESILAHRKYTETKDIVFSQENKDKIAALEKSREDDLNRIRIEKQDLKLASQEYERRLIIYFAFGVIVLMTIVLIIIFRLLKRSDKLLYNVLPVSIAKRLKNKEHPISDYFSQASIVFIDIVGFTALARDADPRKIVDSLNKIFTHYDTIANKYGLEKIKTIGDSYMAAAGIPEVQEDNTYRAAQMALEVKELMQDYKTADGIKIEVRIGLDCGPVVAGVIGENKFIYDMWSDAVNTASRMESSSLAGEVHVSERFRDAVNQFEEFTYVERGEIEVKGKGKMKTYFINKRGIECE